MLTKGQYANWEIKRAFIIVIGFSLVIYFDIRAKACNLLLAFLQSVETCLLKVSLLSYKTPNNFLEKLLFVSISSILTESSPFEASKSWDLPRLAFRPVENFLPLCFYIF